MKKLGLMCFALMLTSAAIAQQDDWRNPKAVCVKNCGSSPSEEHCTLFHPCHANDHSAPVQTESPKGYKDDPYTYMPQYTEAYKYHVLHPDNKPGKPLPWQNFASDKFVGVEAQAIMDRYPVPPGMEDWKLYQDWADKLSKYAINVLRAGHTGNQDLETDHRSRANPLLKRDLYRGLGQAPHVGVGPYGQSASACWFHHRGKPVLKGFDSHR